MKNRLRFTLRTWLIVLAGICFLMAIGNYTIKRRYLQHRIVTDATLIYDNNRRYTKTVRHVSSFGDWTSGPSPNVFLRDPRFFSALGKWTNGSLLVCPFDSIDAHGSAPPWINEVLASGELRRITLREQNKDQLDIGLVTRNHGLELLQLSSVSAQPDALANLYRLTSLREMQLTRTTVSLQSLMKRGFPPRLETLRLHSMQIRSEELIALAPCRKLKSLNLSFNAINLQALAECGLPNTLDELLLRETSVTLNDLRIISTCNQLKSLDLSNSRIDLRNCGNLTLPPSLTDLNLANAILDASSFRLLSKLPQLKQLTLDESEFTDDAARGCQLARTLKVFGARETGAGRHVVRAISQANALESVNFHAAQIDDEALKELGAKTQLEVLLLGENRITDDSSVSLARYPNLSRLELIRTQVTDVLFDTVPRLLDIKDLRIDGSGVRKTLERAPTDMR